MKIPRWLVGVMLGTSAAAIIVAAAFWWLTWPTRTIREFTTLVEQGRFDEANQLLKPPSRLRIDTAEVREKVVVEVGVTMLFAMEPVREYSPDAWRSWCTLENLQTDSRSVTEMIRGRQQFSFHRQFTTPVFIGGHAERGSIVLRYENWAAH
jgi:hypothetical protein